MQEAKEELSGVRLAFVQSEPIQLVEGGLDVFLSPKLHKFRCVAFSQASHQP